MVYTYNDLTKSDLNPFIEGRAVFESHKFSGKGTQRHQLVNFELNSADINLGPKTRKKIQPTRESKRWEHKYYLNPNLDPKLITYSEIIHMMGT